MNRRRKYFFIITCFTILYFICLDIATKQKNKTVTIPSKIEKKKTPRKSKKVQPSLKYKYRKYTHVTRFYQRLALPVTELCVKYKVPPGAVLSILSLESGWGQGYIGQITGNFLSLNATKSEVELPALQMPKDLITGKTILDSDQLSKIPEANIVWEDRPPSLKKDYRPDSIAGSTKNLDFLLKHPEEMTKANLQNVSDFVSRFISKTSSIKAYRQARELLDKTLQKEGIEALFTDDLNRKFIYTIGGKPNSFNFRNSWPRKVMSIYRNVGANKLAKQLYIEHQEFEDVW
ncbi:hypothetical protein [Ochrovirga pacifica]|uniref:hypothetical protein n=1 Tax=Ochrovirga pacifica TaxID=1042376 RepID=UPI0002558AAF|nr:hypothetical protein [Ochrovirga pacifica]